eukprot:Clim_evm22s147 gene=Clim_evmTU22s147
MATLIMVNTKSNGSDAHHKDVIIRSTGIYGKATTYRKSSSQLGMELLGRQLCSNLRLLGFESDRPCCLLVKDKRTIQHLQRSQKDFPVDLDDFLLFSRPQKRASYRVLHFLLCIYDETQALSLFGLCYPCQDKRQEKEFRDSAFKMIEVIHSANELPRMSASLLLNPGGERFLKFLLSLSNAVIKAAALRNSKKDFLMVSDVWSELTSLAFSPHNNTCHVLHVPTLVGQQAFVTKMLKDYIKAIQTVHRERSEWIQFTTKTVGLLRQLRKIEETERSRNVHVSQKDSEVIFIEREQTNAAKSQRVTRIVKKWDYMTSLISNLRELLMVNDNILKHCQGYAEIKQEDVLPSTVSPEIMQQLREDDDFDDLVKNGQVNLATFVKMWLATQKRLYGASQSQQNHLSVPMNLMSTIERNAEQLHDLMFTNQTLIKKLQQLNEELYSDTQSNRLNTAGYMETPQIKRAHEKIVAPTPAVVYANPQRLNEAAATPMNALLTKMSPVTAKSTIKMPSPLMGGLADEIKPQRLRIQMETASPLTRESPMSSKLISPSTPTSTRPRSPLANVSLNHSGPLL